MFVTAALAPRGPIEPRCICPKQLWKHIVLEVKAVWEALNFWTSSLQAQEVQILSDNSTVVIYLLCQGEVDAVWKCGCIIRMTRFASRTQKSLLLCLQFWTLWHRWLTQCPSCVLECWPMPISWWCFYCRSWSSLRCPQRSSSWWHQWNRSWQLTWWCRLKTFHAISLCHFLNQPWVSRFCTVSKLIFTHLLSAQPPPINSFETMKWIVASKTPYTFTCMKQIEGHKPKASLIGRYHSP